MTEEDLPWAADLGTRRYPGNFDCETSAVWMRNIVLKSPMAFQAIRTSDAFAVTNLSTVVWHPNDIEANVQIVCADHGAMWQALALMRASIAWARKRRATVWKLSGDTDYDLGPMARRLGATDKQPRFALVL